jgi:hypothetical protein
VNPSQIDLPTTVAGELALHPRQPVTVIDDEVVSSRLGQRDRDVEPHRRERGNGAGCGDVALPLRRAHITDRSGMGNHLSATPYLANVIRSPSVLQK